MAAQSNLSRMPSQSGSSFHRLKVRGNRGSNGIPSERGGEKEGFWTKFVFEKQTVAYRAHETFTR